MEARASFPATITNICYMKKVFYFFQGLFEDAIHCYNSLNAWHLPLSNCARVVSFPCIKSRTVSTAICKINLWERGKAYVTLTGGSSNQFTLYPLSNRSMNRRLHSASLSTAIIYKVTRQFLFIYNFLKSLKKQCFWFCGGRAIMKDGSVNHVGQWLFNATFTTRNSAHPVNQNTVLQKHEKQLKKKC